MEKTTAAKPVPHPSDVSQPYWDGLKQGVLTLQRCARCERYRHYPRLVCDNCYSVDVEWVEASGRGTLHSWTVSHHAFHPGFAGELPYILAIVDLEEGVRAMGRLGGVSPGEIRIGLAVRFSAEQRDDGLALPHFLPTAAR